MPPQWPNQTAPSPTIVYTYVQAHRRAPDRDGRRSPRCVELVNDDPDHQPVAVVLAAGKGTRFGSATPKVLQPLAGRPLLGHVLATLTAAGLTRVVLVVGYGADQVRAAFPTAQFALQTEQRGTGHALLMARAACAHAGTVVLVYGDVPLIEAPTIEAVLAAKRAPGVVMVAVTCDAGDPTGMGRIVRDTDGRPLAVVEERVATADQKAITEWNVGLYAFDATWLWPRLAALPPSPTG
ncbi:MAG: NTP transferase domain-containing protein, partial [Dehalococcoidia bacterium]|nr:NTP transferase domain-containing protein [Dehalococcoidia bacterium]